MRHLFNEYGGIVIALIITTSILFNLSTKVYPTIVNTTPPAVNNVDAGDNSNLHQTKKPTIVAKSAILNLGDEFVIEDYVNAYSPEGESLTVTIVGQGIDTKTRGKYVVTFKCDYQQVSAYTKAVYIVE